jgi:2-polyprenyl-3-methyl-5-hydroxy-6-metoxy-1,4-benzoquinol methylase
MANSTVKGMEWNSATPGSATPYLLEPVLEFARSVGTGGRVLDVGCGNGYWAGPFLERGCNVVGIDPSPTGIDVARRTFPDARFECMEAGADLIERLEEDPFDLIVSSEVIEHLYDPHDYAAGCLNALRPGGLFVLSTPYHGRLKDIALAVSGKSEVHHDSLRTGGHIKFFTNDTLETLLVRAGFQQVQFAGAGRLPYLWKSIVACAERRG